MEEIINEIRAIFEEWDVRGICEDSLEGYEQGVMLELVGLCEKLRGEEAKLDGNRNPLQWDYREDVRRHY